MENFEGNHVDALHRSALLSYGGLFTRLLRTMNRALLSGHTIWLSEHPILYI
jgi:hypothetical protein